MKRLISALALLFVFGPLSSQAQDPLIGEIKMVGFNFCPRGWVEADGQLLSIAENSALFSLYGTIYGGDGRTTFALPDLRGRAPIHVGSGPGLSTYVEGEKGGVETVTLTPSELPAHSHTIPELSSPGGTDKGLVLRNGNGGTTANTSVTGSGLAHENRPPFLTVRFCVATVGIFPSRN